MKRILVVSLAMASVAAYAQQTFSLNQALRNAQSNRPALEAARLRVSQAMLSRQGLSAFPAARLLLGYTSEVAVGGMDDDLVVAQPLDIFGRTSAAKRSGNALVAQAEAELRLATAEVQSEVVSAYIESAASTELAHIALHTQDTLQRLYAAIEQRVKEGFAPGVQLTRVGIELDQAKLRTEQRQAERKANLQRLASLIGSNEGVSIAEGFPNLDTPVFDVAALQKQRSDLLLLAANVQAADADVRIARLNGMPELEIQGRRSPWQERDDRYGARIQLNIPIFDYGKVKSETKAAGKKAEAARKALEDATKVAAGEVAALRIELDSAKEQVSRYEKIVQTAEQLIERLRPALTEQATTLIEVLDATRAFREAEEALAESRTRLAIVQAKYLKATGQIIEVSQ